MTLFPFLAVLVCAMGALILLLLVTTRRIRQQELAKWERQAKPVVAEVEPLPEPVPVVPIEEPEPVDDGPALVPLLDDDYEERLASRLQEIEAARRAYELARRQREDEAAEARSRLRQRIASLEQEEQRLNAAWNAIQAQSADLDRRIADLTARSRESAQLAEQSDRQARSLAAQLDDVQSRRAALLEQERSLRSQLDNPGRMSPPAKPKFEIVAYDGASGTNRRPILIECRADGLTFAAERITLTPEQLNGFPPEKNPIRSGTEALLTYWKDRDRQSGEQGGEPYVLLIVRPGGTVGFYVARKLLEQLEHEYGYELVNAPEEILWPDADAGAVDVCRNAVESVLSERDRIAGRTRSGRVPVAQEHEYAGKDGLFHIPEIDQLQQRKGSPSLASPSWMPQRPIKNRYETGAGPDGDPPAFPTRVAQAPDLQPPDGVTIVPPAPASAVPPTGSARSTGTPDSSPPPKFAEVHDLRNLRSPGTTGNPSPATGGPENVTADLNVPTAVSSSSSSPSQERLPGNPFAPPTNGRPKSGAQRSTSRPQQEGIGIEREAVVHLRADRVEVEEVPEALTGSLDRLSLQAGLTHLLAAHAAAWGEAPSPFFWKPTMKIIVHPGGNQHLPRVQELAKSWEIETRQEFSLD